jgi:hypothetical protein
MMRSLLKMWLLKGYFSFLSSLFFITIINWLKIFKWKIIRQIDINSFSHRRIFLFALIIALFQRPHCIYSLLYPNSALFKTWALLQWNACLIQNTLRVTHWHKSVSLSVENWCPHFWHSTLLNRTIFPWPSTWLENILFIRRTRF